MSEQAIREDLVGAAGADNVMVDDASLNLMASDLYECGSKPAAIVCPTSSQAVAASIAAAARHGFAVLPRGGGLSYTGGYTHPNSQAIIIDLSAMNRIVSISEEDLVITVETGVTWKQIDEALRPHGLRLPFFGTFSGAGATVGGGLSHGALFFGSARYESAAETVLELEVALADGSLINTGQGALNVESKPFIRSFGPDLTGLFVHDGGALGIKTRASLRLIRAPAEEGFASFAFDDLQSSAKALSEIARSDLTEEAYILDPAAADTVASTPARVAWAVAQQAGGPLRSARAMLVLARGGKKPIPAGSFSLHMVAAGRTRSAVTHDLNRAARIARSQGGQRISPTVPYVARATRFSNLDGVLDDDGGRWAALNAKVAHSDAGTLIAAFDAMIAPHSAEMARRGVRLTYLASALGRHSFSFEVVFHWQDEWTALHRHVLSEERRPTVTEPEANPSARVLVDGLRQETVELFRKHGAASNQIGRTYPYVSALKPVPASVLKEIKSLLDPNGIMNPGVIGLSN